MKKGQKDRRKKQQAEIIFSIATDLVLKGGLDEEGIQMVREMKEEAIELCPYLEEDCQRILAV